MTDARRMYLFAAAVLALVLAGSPADVDAQGLTCGWCVMDYREGHVFGPDGDYVGSVFEFRHKFLEGGNECGWEGHDEPGAMCSRCGGTSDCHEEFRRGGCHIPCGPDGDDYAVAAEVEDALERGDVTAVALALHAPQEGVSLEFIPAAGSIEVIFSCGPNGAVQRIPVPPAARDRLHAAVAAVAPRE